MLTNAKLHEKRMALRASVGNIAPQVTCLKSGSASPDGGFVICHLKNGLHYLPHFLRHYRAIGVRKFAMIDNGSTDGGKDYLLAQEDCDVYECLADFKSSSDGMLWKNVVIARCQAAAWILSVDIDEFAVYEGWPRISLDEFASACSLRGLSAACGIMIDMYRNGPLARVPHAANSSDLLRDFPWFDGDGYTRVSRHDWRRNDFPRQAIDGGPGKRLLQGQSKPWLAKTPLLLEPGIQYIDPHTVLPVGCNFGPVLIGLLHFRFDGSFVEKARQVEAFDSNKGRVWVYKTFGERLAADPLFSLSYPASERFSSPSQFLAKKMIESLRNV